MKHDSDPIIIIVWVFGIMLITAIIMGLAKQNHEERLSAAGLQQCIISSNIIWQRECEK